MTTNPQNASSAIRDDEGLFPGYKHVESFGDDDDYEEEEVSYVLLDLKGIDQTLVPSSSTYRLIGLDTPSPFLQVAGTIMKGRPRTLIGTELIFKENSEETNGVDRKDSLTYFCSAEKRIEFREVELKPKGSSSSKVPDFVPSPTAENIEYFAVPNSAVSSSSAIFSEQNTSMPSTPLASFEQTLYSDSRDVSFPAVPSSPTPREEFMDVDS